MDVGFSGISGKAYIKKSRYIEFNTGDNAAVASLTKTKNNKLKFKLSSRTPNKNSEFISYIPGQKKPEAIEVKKVYFDNISNSSRLTLENVNKTETGINSLVNSVLRLLSSDICVKRAKDSSLDLIDSKIKISSAQKVMTDGNIFTGIVTLIKRK